jgi:hypothetical protein
MISALSTGMEKAVPFADEVLASASVRTKVPVFARAVECTVVVQWCDGPSSFQLRTQTVPDQVSESTVEIQSVGESQHDKETQEVAVGERSLPDDDGLAAQP